MAKTVCPSCGRHVDVDGQGCLLEHKTSSGWVCCGSGETPRELLRKRSAKFDHLLERRMASISNLEGEE